MKCTTCTLAQFCSHHHAFLLLSIHSAFTFYIFIFIFFQKSWSPSQKQNLAESLLHPCDYLPFFLMSFLQFFTCKHPESCLMMFFSTTISVFPHLSLSTVQYECGSTPTAILFPHIILCSLVMEKTPIMNQVLEKDQVENVIPTCTAYQFQ